jgi:hypothetical protein
MSCFTPFRHAPPLLTLTPVRRLATLIFAADATLLPLLFADVLRLFDSWPMTV